ncbi:MAG: cyclase family protein [Solirubrobacterales bacterium]
MSGEAAERGALARIGAAAVLEAAGLVRTGEVIDLAVPLGPATPVPAHRHRVARFMERDGGDYAAGARRPGGFQFAEDTVLMPTHAGTHLDALAHCWHDGRLCDGSPQETIRSTTGAQRCGAEKLGPVLTRGILLDVAGEAEPEAGRSIGAAELEAAAERAGVEVGEADAVLVRTGWLGRHGADGAAYFAGEPGIDLGAARWLTDRGVSLVGADNFAIEPLPFPAGEVFPVHQHLIAEHGVPLLESASLDRLAARADGPFLFVALPLPLVGSTASPLTPVAVL